MEKNRNVNFTDLSGQNNSGLSAGNASGGQHPDYQKELLALLRSGMSPKLLKEEIRNYHENDIADVLEQLSREERARLYCLLDAQTLSDVLEYTDDFALYFSELGVRKQSEILSHLETDTAVEYLRQLNKTERATLIDLMDDETRRDIALIGSFDEDEIGSRMTTNYIAVPAGIEVRQAMRSLIAQAAEFERQKSPYFAWDILENASRIDPADPVLARAIARLAPEVSDYVKSLNRAKDAENKKEFAAALNYYLAAQKIFPASQACRMGIERVAEKY